MKTSTLSQKKNKLKANHRPPQPIKSEAILVKTYLQALQKNPKKGLFTTTEFDCANGIADIVNAKLKKNWKKNNSISDISPRWLYALRDLPYRRVFSLETFRAISGASSSRVREALKEFIKAGYCKQTNKKNNWIKTKQPIEIAINIQAIEAKLKDWGRALNQAHRYRDFANESFVLLDHAKVHSALDNLKTFQALGVSLISISIDGKIYTHYRAKKTTPRSAIKRWQANCILANRLTKFHRNIA